MAARTGKQVLDRLKTEPPALWVEGTLVADPTAHPRTTNVAHALAALYDLQHRDDLIDTSARQIGRRQMQQLFGRLVFLILSRQFVRVNMKTI